MWYEDFSKVPNADFSGAVLAPGYFDALHAGHLKLIREAKAEAARRGKAFVLLSYAKEVVAGTGFLFSEKEKEYLLETLALTPDAFISLPVNDPACDLSADEFCASFLKDCFGEFSLAAGPQLKLGREWVALADCDKRLPGAEGALLVPPFLHEGSPLTDAMVVSLLREGKPSRAKELMGHGYLIIGPVVHGKALGRTVGMPTANLGFAQERMILREGVYGSLVLVDGKYFIALTNVGRRPSVDDYAYFTVESFILDFDQDIYDREIILEVHEFIRDTKAFSNLEEVKKQVDQDILNIIAKLKHLVV